MGHPTTVVHISTFDPVFNYNGHPPNNGEKLVVYWTASTLTFSNSMAQCSCPDTEALQYSAIFWLRYKVGRIDDRSSSEDILESHEKDALKFLAVHGGSVEEFL